MNSFFLYAILGLGAGAAYSLLGIGAVVIYKGSGVVNFAQGSIALVAAVVEYRLKSAGWPTGAAIVAALLAAVVAGVLIYLLIMRLLRNAPMLARNVATLGVLLTIVAAVPLLYPAIEAASLNSFLPQQKITFLGVTFGRDRLYMLVIACLVTAILAVVFHRTRLGLATRAVAESELAASILGFSPATISLFNWMLGTLLAGLAGILIAPIAGLNPATITFLVVPALTAALIGNFSSFGLTLLGGLGIGIVQSECLNFAPNVTGLADALPLVLIVIVMAVRSQAIPARDVLIRGRAPVALEGKFRVWYLVPAVLIVLFVTPHIQDQYAYALQTSLCFAIVFLSQTIVTGFVGQISLAQLSFTGLGVLLAARFATNLHLPFPLPILLTAIAAVPIGAILGLPAVRVRGINLAVLTLALAAAVSSFVFGQAGWTGAPDTSTLPDPSLFGLNLNAISYPQRYLMVTLIFLAISAWITVRIRRGRLGRQFLSVRENERAAAAVGISVWRTKLTAFSIAAAMAGAAGALLAYQAGTITYDAFSAPNSVTILAESYILGVGSVFGAILAGIFTNGGVLTTYLSATFSDSVNNYIPMVSGLLLILTVIQNPDGVVPLASRQINRLRERAATHFAKPSNRAPGKGISPAEPDESPAASVQSDG